MRFVLRRTGEASVVATLVGMAGFVGLAFSEHRGLASLGQTALIGLSMSILAPLIIMPLIIGYLEERDKLQPEAQVQPGTELFMRHPLGGPPPGGPSGGPSAGVSPADGPPIGPFPTGIFPTGNRKRGGPPSDAPPSGPPEGA
jgi:hypothetical protein